MQRNMGTFSTLYRYYEALSVSYTCPPPQKEVQTFELYVLDRELFHLIKHMSIQSTDLVSCSM